MAAAVERCWPAAAMARGWWSEGDVAMAFAAPSAVSPVGEAAVTRWGCWSASSPSLGHP